MEIIKINLLAEYIEQDWLWTERILQEYITLETTELEISMHLSNEQMIELNQQEEKWTGAEKDPIAEGKNQNEMITLSLIYAVKKMNWEEVYEEIIKRKKVEEAIYKEILKHC
jgi:hypothetical protein